MCFWGFRKNEPLVSRGASRHGTGDRSSNGHRLKKATRPLQPGVFFRGPDRYKASKRRYERSRDEVPCQESPCEFNRSAARRDFPRRGCRMGGSAFYSRGGELVQGEMFKRSEATRNHIERNSREFNILVVFHRFGKCRALPVTRYWPPAQVSWRAANTRTLRETPIVD